MIAWRITLFSDPMAFVSDSDDSYRWNEVDKRFSVDDTPNEPNRFGWVGEIDPYAPHSVPRKHTALGRIKHESAVVTLAPDNCVVVYMGDDQKFEYIYKFVSEGKFNPRDRKAYITIFTFQLFQPLTFSGGEPTITAPVSFSLFFIA